MLKKLLALSIGHRQKTFWLCQRANRKHAQRTKEDPKTITNRL